MDLTPLPVTVGATRAPDRCIVRGQRLVQVKFVSLPLEEIRIERRLFSTERKWGPSLNSLISFIHRVIGRLVAARP